MEMGQSPALQVCPDQELSVEANTEFLFLCENKDKRVRSIKSMTEMRLL